MKKSKRAFKFKDEDAERRYWATRDFTKHFDLSKAQPVSFPNLKPSMRPISLRVPESLLNEIKSLANKKDIPYQSLMKVILSDWVSHHHAHA